MPAVARCRISSFAHPRREKMMTEEVRKLAKNQSSEKWSDILSARASVNSTSVTSALNKTILRMRLGQDTIVLQSYSPA